MGYRDNQLRCRQYRPGLVSARSAVIFEKVAVVP
jgi:hypothetical protein